MKDKLARQKQSLPKSSTVLTDLHHTDTQVCEICERPGHDIFNCDVLSKKTPATPQYTKKPLDLFCDDCESHGHLAADCPHSLDVF